MRHIGTANIGIKWNMLKMINRQTLQVRHMSTEMTSGILVPAHLFYSQSCVIHTCKRYNKEQPL